MVRLLTSKNLGTSDTFHLWEMRTVGPSTGHAKFVRRERLTVRKAGPKL